MFTLRQEGAGQDHRQVLSAYTASTITAEMLDSIKAMGYKYSTKACADRSRQPTCIVPEGKDEMIRESEKKVAKIDRKYKRGFITDQERYRLTVAELGRDHQEGYRKAAGQHEGAALQPDSHDG